MNRSLDIQGVTTLALNDRVAIRGGSPAFWAGIAVGLAARGVYDFVNGVYAGIKLELAEKE